MIGSSFADNTHTERAGWWEPLARGTGLSPRSCCLKISSRACRVIPLNIYGVLAPKVRFLRIAGGTAEVESFVPIRTMGLFFISFTCFQEGEIL